jgi:hypothetical protein
VPVTAKVNGWVRHKHFADPYAQVKIYIQAEKVLYYHVYPPPVSGSNTTGILITRLDSTSTDLNGFFSMDMSGLAAYDKLLLVAVPPQKTVGYPATIPANQQTDSLVYPLTTRTQLRGPVKLINNHHPPLNIIFPSGVKIGTWLQIDTVTYAGSDMPADTVNLIKYEYIKNGIPHTKYDTIRLSHHQDSVYFIFNIDPSTF